MRLAKYHIRQEELRALCMKNLRPRQMAYFALAEPNDPLGRHK